MTLENRMEKTAGDVDICSAGTDTLDLLIQMRPYLYYDRTRYVVQVKSGKSAEANLAQKQGRLTWDWKVASRSLEKTRVSEVA